MKTVDYTESIEARDLIVGRCKQIIESSGFLFFL